MYFGNVIKKNMKNMEYETFKTKKENEELKKENKELKNQNPKINKGGLNQ